MRPTAPRLRGHPQQRLSGGLLWAIILTALALTGLLGGAI